MEAILYTQELRCYISVACKFPSFIEGLPCDGFTKRVKYISEVSESTYAIAYGPSGLKN
jgi:hypothetical protein